MCEKYSTDVASEDDSGDNDCPWPCIRKNAGQEDGEEFSWKASVPSLTLCHAQAAPKDR